MRPSHLHGSLLCAAIVFGFVAREEPKADRARSPRVVTELEWAAVNLQASYGAMDLDAGLWLRFEASPSGTSIHAYVTLPASKRDDADAAKTSREGCEMLLDGYKQANKADWLTWEIVVGYYG